MTRDLQSHCYHWSDARAAWVCCRCKRRVSPQSQTIFRRSRCPLRIWFAVLWLLAIRRARKQRLAANEICRSFSEVEDVKTAQRILRTWDQALTAVEPHSFRFVLQRNNLSPAVFICRHGGPHEQRGLFVYVDLKGLRPLEEWCTERLGEEPPVDLPT
jgi:hypothetical protein